MRRFNDNEYVDVYHDFDHKLYAPGNNGAGYVLEPKNEDGEIFCTQMLWRDVRNLNNKTRVFKKGKVRFEESIEADAYAQLRIIPEKEKDYYTQQRIEEMITNPSDDILKEILSIKNEKVLKTFLTTFIGLKNTNQYFLADKMEIYIRARIEEVKKGVMKSELLVTPTVNEVAIEENVVEEVAEEVEEKPKKTTRKRAVVKKTT